MREGVSSSEDGTYVTPQKLSLEHPRVSQQPETEFWSARHASCLELSKVVYTQSIILFIRLQIIFILYFYVLKLFFYLYFNGGEMKQRVSVN